MASRALSYGALSERVLSSSCKLAVAHSCKGFSRRRFSLSASSSSSASSSEVHRLHSPPPSLSQKTHFFSTTAPEPLPPLPRTHQQWHLTDQHLFLLTTIACVTGGAVTALFVAAIPTLLAFKKAAESLEKLLEVTREELPGTMAAVRLSGMEISDLTMELSELGQEISSGVKSSARAVRAAQDGLRRVSSIASMGEKGTQGRVNETSSGGNKGSS